MRGKKAIALLIVITIGINLSLPLQATAMVFGNRTAFCVGTNYGLLDINTTSDATYAATAYSSLGLSCNTVTIPTRTIVNGNHPSGNANMSSGIVFLSGHGSSSTMAFNYKNQGGTYYVGITSNTYDYVGSNGCYYYSIDNYTLSNVALYVFAGCETAMGTSNLSQKAYSSGAEISLGWTVDVSSLSHPNWLERFNDALEDGYSVDDACDEADSFSYLSNSVKQHASYGNSDKNPMYYIDTLIIASPTNRRNRISIYEGENPYEAARIAEKYVEKVAGDKSTYFKEEESRNDKRIIWDYTYYYGEIRTNYAYTFIYDGNNLWAYSNTYGIDIRELTERMCMVTEDEIIEKSVSIRIKDRDFIMSNCIDVKDINQFVFYDVTESKYYQITDYFAYDDDGLTYSNYLSTELWAE